MGKYVQSKRKWSMRTSLISSLLLFALIIICPNELLAQSHTVSGTVYDSKTNETLIGVGVKVEGTSTQGTITDIDGNFTLKGISADAILVISYIGYKVEEVKVSGKKSLKISLDENINELNEVQVVAYGAQKKVTITGAISALSGDELLKTPTGSLTNALAGKITGVSTVQYSGEPGADAADIYVRGIVSLNSSAPLVQVDGVERDFSQLDPNEIESITVLKDASATAVFGIRGANGVILVTTKRGTEGKPKISISTSAGVQVPTRLLEFANSYQYATYYNEAQANDGVAPSAYRFQPDVLDAFKNHTNPLLYPDTDWLDMLLKKSAFQSQHNVNISGGTENVRYFVSVGAFTQSGLFKTLDAGYDFNFDYKRYNYRANIDFDISKSTVLSVNLGGRVDDKNTPISNEDQGQLFRHLYWATPFSGAGIVDGKWIKTNSDYISTPGADGLSPFYGKGFRSKVTNTLNLDLALEQKLDMLTKGLSVKLKGAYNTDYYHTKVRTSTTPYYTPILTSTGDIELRKSGDDAELGYGEEFNRGRNWYMEVGANYNRKFQNHNFGALLLYNQSKKYYPRSYTEIPTGYVGMVGRVTYDFKSRYMAEFNAGYNGSENFHPDRRYGFFPAGSVGWIISEENFMKDVKKYITYLKVRASYGIVGNDRYSEEGAYRFLYIPDSYDWSGSYNFGTNVGSNQSGASEKSKSNQFATWEKAYKQNYGLDIFTLDDRLKYTLDVFKEHRENILIQSNTAPGYLGMSLPVVNNGIVDSHGYEMNLKWEDKIGSDFKYFINANLSFARNKIIEKDEVRPNEEYMRETGRPVNQKFGYTFWGFYDETANERYKLQFGRDIAEHSVSLAPGDCVYVDLNGDGVINGDDVTAIGYTDVPEYVAGLNAGFSWKGFDFSMQFTGAWNASRMLSETLREPMGDTNSKGLLLSQFENRWTPDNPNASLPRATLAHKSNNYIGSTLFLKDASYLRLKNIEIGYNFESGFLKKMKISTCRVYVNGYNLLTFDKLKITDPESRTSDRPNYPLTKVFNLGLKLGF